MVTIDRPWQPWHVVESVIERPHQTIEKYGVNLKPATVTDPDEDRVAEGKFFRSKPISTGMERALLEMVRHTGIRLQVDEMEPLHIVRYPVGGHYAWHVDTDYSLEANGKHRKYTVVVPLNKAVRGGGTELMWSNGKPVQPSVKPGDALIFPSTMVHRAKPVKEGERWVLVGWFMGQPLR